MRFFWALVLFSLGIIFLGAEFNLWGYDKVQEIWQFWPLILIFWGLDLLTKRLKFGWILVFLVMLFSGFFLYDLVLNNSAWFGVKSISNQRQESVTYEIKGPREVVAERQVVNINAGAIDFSVEDESDYLFNGSLDSSVMKPEITSKLEEGIFTSDISIVRSERSFWLGYFRYVNKMNISFNGDLPLSLNFKTGASSLDLDLSGYNMESLNIDAGASSVKIRLGDNLARDFAIRAKTGASRMEIFVPKGVKVNVNSSSALSDVDLPKDWGDVEKTINLDLGSAATSVKIVHY